MSSLPKVLGHRLWLSITQYQKVVTYYYLCLKGDQSIIQVPIIRPALFVNTSPQVLTVWGQADKEQSQVTGGLLTICSPLLCRTPSCSTRFLEMVMEGRSRLCGGNWGVNSFPWEGNGSLRAWKGSSTSGMPRVGSDSGGGVIGGISNSSSPRLGVWNVC